MARTDTTHDAFWSKPGKEPWRAAQQPPERRRKRQPQRRRARGGLGTGVRNTDARGADVRGTDLRDGARPRAADTRATRATREDLKPLDTRLLDARLPDPHGSVPPPPPAVPPAHGARRHGARRASRAPHVRDRRARRSLFGASDRMGTGAMVLSVVVGLAMLAIVERSLLGGPATGPNRQAGAERGLADRRPRDGAPARSRPSAAPPGPAAPAPAAPPGPDLRRLAADVRVATVNERGPAARAEYGVPSVRTPLVTVDRTSRDRTWAFGTTAIPVPAGSRAVPQIAFFAARWTVRDGWRTALSGTPAFTAIAAGLPAAVMSAGEGRALVRFSALSAGRAPAAAAADRLMLPWRAGTAWAMDTADFGRPLSALSFSGGDGVVRAAAGGRLYRFCGAGLLMIVHDSGLASAYDGLHAPTALRDGSAVGRGDVLGRTGTARPCGGAPLTHAQVGFTLRRGDGSVPLDGVGLGGWVFRETGAPPAGRAERGPLQVLPGGLLANLGPVPAATAPPDPAPTGDAGDAGDDPSPAPEASADGAAAGAPLDKEPEQ
ncbi:hypothetical protein [Actinomadura parmotrematis]|uniref:M23 family metallopeptidase n=1 Tax=Actinomadura parmotrematis TaxID=2864039 RepID=A0ABS7FKH7_9ACTN|nr:hypothetical protein [Actinomadura parmotrematis]MBW8480861.1 hypothetical protein [Actinomadura parmotrematis]